MLAHLALFFIVTVISVLGSHLEKKKRLADDARNLAAYISVSVVAAMFINDPEQAVLRGTVGIVTSFRAPVSRIKGRGEQYKRGRRRVIVQGKHLCS